jgi:hypothetical protein
MLVVRARDGTRSRIARSPEPTALRERRSFRANASAISVQPRSNDRALLRLKALPRPSLIVSIFSLALTRGIGTNP